jgi:hypothetical protein
MFSPRFSKGIFMKRNKNNRRTARWPNGGLMWLCLCVGILAVVSEPGVSAADTITSPAPLLAQGSFDQAFGSGGDPNSGTSIIDWNGWPVKVVLISIAFFAAALFCFLVLFRWLLSKSKPWWPLTAYGFCSAAILTITFAVALFVLWDNLVFGTSGAKAWWMEQGGRLLLVVAWLLIVSIILSVVRSPHGRATSK